MAFSPNDAEIYPKVLARYGQKEQNVYYNDFGHTAHEEAKDFNTRIFRFLENNCNYFCCCLIIENNDKISIVGASTTSMMALVASPLLW